MQYAVSSIFIITGEHCVAHIHVTGHGARLVVAGKSFCFFFATRNLHAKKKKKTEPFLNLCTSDRTKETKSHVAGLHFENYLSFFFV